jgi:transposase-like protein
VIPHSTVKSPKLWRAARDELTSFLAYGVEIRRVLFSTTAIEGRNSRYRRAATAWVHFPTGQAALKCLYLVTCGTASERHDGLESGSQH